MASKSFLTRPGLRAACRGLSLAVPGKQHIADFVRLLIAPSPAILSFSVDSETAVAANNSPWEHLKRRDDWTQPSAAADDGAQLMVQCMEAWFVADRQSLSAYFGKNFRGSALPERDNVETIAKNDLERTLKQATKSCAKGPYRKGRHSFDLLGCLDPSKVIESSHHARQLIDALRRP